VPCFLFGKPTGDYGTAAVNRLIDMGRAFPIAIKQNGDLSARRSERLRQVAEDFRSFGIQRERYTVSLLVKVSVGTFEVFTGELRTPLNEQLELLVLPFDTILVGFYHVVWRHDFLATFNACDPVPSAGNRGQLELGNTLQFALGCLDLAGI